MARFAAPSLDQPERERIGCGRSGIIGCRQASGDIVRQQAVDIPGRLQHLAAAHHQTRHHVAVAFDDAFVPDRSCENAPRVRGADVAGRAARAGRLSHAADAQHLLARHDAALFETGQQRGRGLDVAAHLVVAAGDFADVAADRAGRPGVERMVRAAGADEALAEAVAAPRLRGVDRHGAQRLAGDLSQLVTHVHAERSRVGDVHGHAFEFERDGSFAVERRWCALLSGQFLAQLRVGRGVRHGAVARDGFGQTRLPQPVLRSGELGLRTAVLVAQRDFEVEDLLAVADEAEGPRFDDSGVDRPDVHFVQRASFHRVEGVVVDRAAAVVAVGGEPQRFGPRHGVEPDAVALRDVAFEGVHLRVQGRERRQSSVVVVLRGVRGDEHAAPGVVEQQAEEAHPVARGKGEIVRHVVLRPGEARGQLVVEFGVGDLGNVAQRDVQGAVVGRIPVHSDTI